MIRPGARFGPIEPRCRTGKKWRPRVKKTQSTREKQKDKGEPLACHTAYRVVKECSPAVRASDGNSHRAADWKGNGFTWEALTNPVLPSNLTESASCSGGMINN